MNGKIDINGALNIERAGKYKIMECKKYVSYVEYQGNLSGAGYHDNLSKTQYSGSCKDDCPLFGEPVEEATAPNVFFCMSGRITLTICENRTLVFNEFIDERQINKEIANESNTSCKASVRDDER